jgi:polysaccharide deacetylase 2 family uncharacterized protein YibQ
MRNLEESERLIIFSDAFLDFTTNAVKVQRNLNRRLRVFTRRTNAVEAVQMEQRTLHTIRQTIYQELLLSR